MLEPHPVYKGLAKTPEERNAVYRELLFGKMDKDIINDIREALNHELVLGQSYFKEKVEQITKRQTTMGKPGRPKVEEERASYSTGYLVY